MKRALTVVLFLLLAATARADDDFFLKDKDTVVFFGDSITAQRLYTTYVETYVVTRRPDLDVRFVHSGWGGDTVRGGAGGPIDKRLERDVIAYKPTVVTIMLGMNDGQYRPLDEKIFDTYKKGMEHIVLTLKAKLPGVRLVLIEPSPHDDVTRKPAFENGYNSVLVKYGEFVRELAKKEGCTSVDLNAPVVQCLEKANGENAALAQEIIRDRVHPGPAGHLVMAKALLEAWKAPTLISDVTIDAAANKVTKTENATVAEVDSLTWTQTDKVLPLPLDTRDHVVALALHASGLFEALDRELLTVTGLTAERYELSIDDVKVGVFPKDRLEKGLNLARFPTPMRHQALEVHALTKRRVDLLDMRWHQLVVGFEGKESAALTKALDGLTGLADELRDEQRAAAKPKAHKFKLVPVN